MFDNQTFYLSKVILLTFVEQWSCVLVNWYNSWSLAKCNKVQNAPLWVAHFGFYLEWNNMEALRAECLEKYVSTTYRSSLLWHSSHKSTCPHCKDVVLRFYPGLQTGEIFSVKTRPGVSLARVFCAAMSNPSFPPSLLPSSIQTLYKLLMSDPFT